MSLCKIGKGKENSPPAHVFDITLKVRTTEIREGKEARDI
jgi:hypothetical protein